MRQCNACGEPLAYSCLAEAIEAGLHGCCRCGTSAQNALSDLPTEALAALRRISRDGNRYTVELVAIYREGTGRVEAIDYLRRMYDGTWNGWRVPPHVLGDRPMTCWLRFRRREDAVDFALACNQVEHVVECSATVNVGELESTLADGETLARFFH